MEKMDHVQTAAGNFEKNVKLSYNAFVHNTRSVYVNDVLKVKKYMNDSKFSKN